MSFDAAQHETARASLGSRIDGEFDVAATLDALAKGEPVAVASIDYVRAVVFGEILHFAVAGRFDSIQKHHRLGQFYEEQELALIRGAFPIGGVFLDIGANVGNHALFAAKFLHAARVIVVEPNPEACRYLVANVLMNGFERQIDLSRIGVALSDAAAEGCSVRVPRRNLGGARLSATGGSIIAVRGDDLLRDVDPDFVKIDVEGMEIKVLAGLSDMIARCRPRLFVEVDDGNADAFADWCATNGSRIKARFRRYKTNENYLVQPRRQRKPVSAAAGGSAS